MIFLNGDWDKKNLRKPIEKSAYYGKWVLITSKPVPGSFNSTYKDQLNLIDKYNNYSIPDLRIA